MWPQWKFLFPVLFILSLLEKLGATLYRLEPESEEYLTDCPNQPSNVLGIKNGLFDFSELTFYMDFDKVTVSGNVTTIWNIEPTDRIQVKFIAYMFDRGSWVPTVFSLTIDDFCKDLFDKNQYWYTFWSKYIANKAEVKSKCFSPGTKFLHNTFDTDFQVDLMMGPQSGRRKLVIILIAFDKKNVKRDTSICSEIIFDLERLTT